MDGVKEKHMIEGMLRVSDMNREKNESDTDAAPAAASMIASRRNGMQVFQWSKTGTEECRDSDSLLLFLKPEKETSTFLEKEKREHPVRAQRGVAERSEATAIECRLGKRTSEARELTLTRKQCVCLATFCELVEDLRTTFSHGSPFCLAILSRLRYYSGARVRAYRVITRYNPPTRVSCSVITMSTFTNVIYCSIDFMDLGKWSIRSLRSLIDHLPRSVGSTEHYLTAVTDSASLRPRQYSPSFFSLSHNRVYYTTEGGLEPKKLIAYARAVLATPAEPANDNLTTFSATTGKTATTKSSTQRRAA